MLTASPFVTVMSLYLLYGNFFVDCRSINIGSVVCDCTRYCGVRIRRRTTFAACSPISYISRFTTLSCGSMILENGKSSNVITAISSGMRIPEAFSSFTQPNAIYWFAQITALGRVCSSSRARAAAAPPSLVGGPSLKYPAGIFSFRVASAPLRRCAEIVSSFGPPMNAILSYPLRHKCVTAICPATELLVSIQQSWLEKSGAPTTM